MEIGRKIYYGKSNGIVIWDKGEMSGSVYETTIDEDCQAMPILTLMPAEELGVKQLQYGELSEQFSTSRGYRINPETEDVEFVTEQ